MKKILLSLFTIGFATMANAQGMIDAAPLKGTPAKEANNSIPCKPFGKAGSKKTRGFGNLATLVGTTWYDLQTNGSMSHRIVNNGNGSISVVWTTSATNNAQTGSFADRGTGYNHKDAATPWAAANGARIENGIRTGFCNILTAGNVEHIYNHNATSRASFGFKNTAIGSSAFTQFVTMTPVNIPDTVIWPKTAVSGSYIYVIGCLSNTPAATDMGLYYNRSADGGATWFQNFIPMPGITKNQYWGASADSYNIDANGANVSVIVGDVSDKMYCIRSADNGNNWVIDTIINNEMPFGVNPVTVSSEVVPGDSIRLGSDGSGSVLVDNAGITHVTYSPVFWSVDATAAAANLANPAAATYSIYFTRTGRSLNYWTPGIQPNFAVAIDSAQDCDNDGAFNFGVNHNVGGATGLSGRYGPYAKTNFSQLCQAATNSDTLFVVYSAIIDGDTTTADISALSGQNFRDVFVKVSFDGGSNWQPRVNISNSPTVEDVFPSVAKLVDGSLHICWQSDNEPGTVLTNGDGQEAGNNILYLAVPKSYIYDHAAAEDAVCQNVLLGPTPFSIFGLDANGNSKYTVSPNPASTQIELKGNVANAKISIVNTMGQVVNANATILNAGSASINIAHLPSGIYFVEVSNGKSKSTTRFVKN